MQKECNIKFSPAYSITPIIAIILTGCGGGGGGGPSIPSSGGSSGGGSSTPAYVPTSVYDTAEYRASGVMEKIGAESAYLEGYTGTGQKIAMIDTGIDLTHPDFSKVTEIWSKASLMTPGGSGTYNGVAVTHLGDTVISKGQFEKITYTQANSNYIYSQTPNVVISGNGTGAVGYALIGSDGKLKGIVLGATGSGYTTATVTLVDPITSQVISNVTATAVLAGQDTNGHGSFTADLAAGVKDNSGIHGVAFDADLIIAKYTSGFGDLGANALEAVAWAQSRGATVINQSFGSYDPAGWSSQSNIGNYASALNAGISIVSAAGNDGKSCADITQCMIPAALPWVTGYSSLLSKNGAWVIVGALNSAGTDIADYSNRAGITMNNYILAPGTATSAAIGGGTTSGSGTSYATPIVSGALALMQQKWPALTGRQSAQILFNTATDLGAPGVDAIYGNGALNLTRAFSPIGHLSLPVSRSTSGGITPLGFTGSAPLPVSTLSLTSAFGSTFSNSTALNNAIILDSYSRDFNVNMTNAVGQSTANFNIDDFATVNVGHFVAGINNAMGIGAVGYKLSKSSTVMLGYSNTLLGSSGAGAFAMKNPQSLYTNYKKILDLDNGWQVQADATHAYAQAGVAQESLITRISPIHAIGGKIKVSKNGWGVGYEIPVRTVSGTSELTVPTSVDANGNVVYTKENNSLIPQAFEQKMSLFYQVRGGMSGLLVSADHTIDKMNVKGLSDNTMKLNWYWYY